MKRIKTTTTVTRKSTVKVKTKTKTRTKQKASPTTKGKKKTKKIKEDEEEEPMSCDEDDVIKTRKKTQKQAATTRKKPEPRGKWVQVHPREMEYVREQIATQEDARKCVRALQTELFVCGVQAERKGYVADQLHAEMWSEWMTNVGEAAISEILRYGFCMVMESEAPIIDREFIAVKLTNRHEVWEHIINGRQTYAAWEGNKRLQDVQFLVWPKWQPDLEGHLRSPWANCCTVVNKYLDAEETYERMRQSMYNDTIFIQAHDPRNNSGLPSRAQLMRTVAQQPVGAASAVEGDSATGTTISLDGAALLNTLAAGASSEQEAEAAQASFYAQRDYPLQFHAPAAEIDLENKADSIQQRSVVSVKPGFGITAPPAVQLPEVDKIKKEMAQEFSSEGGVPQAFWPDHPTEFATNLELARETLHKTKLSWSRRLRSWFEQLWALLYCVEEARLQQIDPEAEPASMGLPSTWTLAQLEYLRDNEVIDLNTFRKRVALLHGTTYVPPPPVDSNGDPLPSIDELDDLSKKDIGIGAGVGRGQKRKRADNDGEEKGEIWTLTEEELQERLFVLQQERQQQEEQQQQQTQQTQAKTQSAAEKDVSMPKRKKRRKRRKRGGKEGKNEPKTTARQADKSASQSVATHSST